MAGSYYTKPVSIATFLAGGAIAANSAVKLSAENTVVVTSAITDDVIGFAQETVASGDRVNVEMANGAIVKVVCGGTIAAGAQLMPKASGSGQMLTAAGATALSCAIALQGGASGETIAALTRYSVKTPANT